MKIEPPVSPVCRLEFKPNELSKTSYILDRAVGQPPSNLLGVYQRTKYKGHSYVTVEKPRKPTGYQYLILTRNREAIFKKAQEKPDADLEKALVSGFNYSFKHKGQAFGDFNGNAMLIEFFPRIKLTLHLFDVEKECAKDLFDFWISGELDLTVKDDIRPLGEPSLIITQSSTQFLTVSPPGAVQNAG